MNCLDFRRRCAADPTSHEVDFRSHAEGCPACRAYLVSQLRLENRIRTAMDIPVPRALPARIELEGLQRPDRRRVAAAIGASVFLALVAVVAASLWTVRGEDLRIALGRHLVEDPLHLMPEEQAAQQELDRVVRQMGGQMQRPLAGVTRVRLCIIEGRPVVHLVLAGEHGRVTVFLMPKHQARPFDEVRLDGHVGVVARAARGSIALFGGEGEALPRIEQEVSAHVRWAS